jgi:hypothetical protein
MIGNSGKGIRLSWQSATGSMGKLVLCAALDRVRGLAPGTGAGRLWIDLWNGHR